MSANNSKKDTHIYNIINNPSKEFTEPCECCGVSEFQLGVKHAEERIINLLDIWDCNNDRCDCDSINECIYRQQLIALINGETK